jgi:DNA-binding Lrp family transcriptional regulator
MDNACFHVMALAAELRFVHPESARRERQLQLQEHVQKCSSCRDALGSVDASLQATLLPGDAMSSLRRLCVFVFATFTCEAGLNDKYKVRDTLSRIDGIAEHATVLGNADLVIRLDMSDRDRFPTIFVEILKALDKIDKLSISFATEHWSRCSQVDMRGNVRAFIAIYTSADRRSSVFETLKGVPCIEEIAYVEGDYDLIAKAVCPTHEDLCALISDEVQPIWGVKQTRTFSIFPHLHWDRARMVDPADVVNDR